MTKTLNFKNIKNEMEKLFQHGIETGNFDAYIDFYKMLNELKNFGFMSRELFNKIWELDEKLNCSLF